MTIGIVLSKPPSYSETFFNSKIKGLSEAGYSVKLFVKENDVNYQFCEVISAPKVTKNKAIQLFKMALVFIGLLPRLKTVSRFIKLEKSSGRSLSQAIKNVYTNSHLLKAKLNWLHFGFSTLAINSENVAESINAKMAVSCRGFDMDVYPLKHPNCYHLVWQKVDKVHAISKYMLAKAHENGLDKSVQNAIIYPAVKANFFHNYSTRKRDKNKPLQITTIVRLHWIKGLSYTLEALSKLKNEGVNFQYQILGSGNEYEALRFAIHQLGLNANVILVGNVSHQQALNRLQETDIYIQYSQSEGFCNAVLEAQAFGNLCVVSDGGALPENILDTKTGFVVPKSKPKVLAEALLKVLKMAEEDLLAIKNKARQRVMADFTIKNQIRQFIEFYE